LTLGQCCCLIRGEEDQFVAVLVESRPAMKASIAPGKMSEAEAARFLLRAQFSASDADIAFVRAHGYAAWLDQQYASPRGQTGVDWLTAHKHDAITKDAHYFWPMAGDFMIWNQILAQPGEMRLRAAYALSQFFVISLNPIDGYWPPTSWRRGGICSRTARSAISATCSSM
jgi:hypothetical protein